jgi:hypothetical protein
MIKPSVMVAEYGNDAGWRMQVRQLHRDVFGRHEVASNDPLNDEVSENADQIGAGIVGARHRVVKFSQPVERRANVKIGKHCDAQSTLVRPRDVEMLLVDAHAGWLEPGRPQRQHERDTSCDGDYESQRLARHS